MVIIGVASIVALTSQAAGSEQNIKNSLESLGPTAILVEPSGKTVFTDADIANLEALQNVSSATPIVTGSGTLTVNGDNYSVSIVGVSSNGLEQVLGNSSLLYEGALYPDGVSPSAVVGYSIAFPSSTDSSEQYVSVGDTGTLTVSSGGRGSSSSATKINVPIVGVLQSHSTSLVSVDSAVILSLPFAEAALHTDTFNEILVKANSAANVSSLTSQIEIIYGDDARVINTAQFADTFASITSSTEELYIIIAGISLLVAAIGIMNVMLMSVSERIHDIGILKSIGFMSRDVMYIFLFQAVVIGVLGGVLGIGVGVVTSYVLSAAGTSTSGVPGGGAATVHIASVAGGGGGSFAPGGGGSDTFVSSSFGAPSSSSSSSHIEPVFTASVILEAMAIAIIVSVIAGIYPAWKASKMEPIDALRTL